jgi:hypothetical protein
MFKRKLLSTAILSASLVAVSTISMAETVTSSATVTVQNAFNLTETAAINFGTLRATGDGSGATPSVATVTIKADNSSVPPTSPGTAELSVITPGSRGEYAVSGAAPFSDLTIEFPDESVFLVNASAPPSTPRFVILPTTNWEATIIGGTNDGATYASSNLQTDVSGAVGFYLGATLTTDERASTAQNGVYTDGVYSGNYTIEVRY